ncbi:FAD-binding oxidoreductase [Streptomyces angustmyceticus]|uniref:Oxidoreductase n=1 Tax=Streptomyces angustmyceticus TaxID=285578 RepID=A0A5J4LMS8_9ACTN|nr:FAD-binding oxidoreductase [Streptomyces angustmyceticus]UAL70361.1 FAD-binding oxidoreductase [Streptomyces angustmyceticus]GES33302.1 oxidoreductase [Streptomyces angustmyceticus]
MGPRGANPAGDPGGTLIRRGEAGYERARTAAVWNERRPRRFPDVIVRAATEADVAHAVGHARAKGLRISTYSGGHNWSGSPLRDHGLLLDLSALRECRVAPATGDGPATATVQPAATGRDLVAALTPQDLAFPVGHCPTVAVGGFLLSGGLGWNSRAWGPSCADVREIRAVTADGRTVTCSETENPDLFWAARGAGPGFCALVTRFRLALHPHPASIMTASLAFPLAEVARVTRWAARTALGSPPYVETSLLLAPSGPPTATAPAGPRITVAATAFATTPGDARQALRPFADCPFGELAADRQEAAPTTFAALHEGAAAAWPPAHRYAADTLWSPEDPATQLTRIADAVARAPSAKSLVLAPVQPVSEDPALLRNMAFSPLGASYLVCYAVWEDPAEDAVQERWLRETMAGVNPRGDGFHYIAETDLEADAARARRSYTPAAWDRLQEIKAQWDPDNLFHSYLAP